MCSFCQEEFKAPWKQPEQETHHTSSDSGFWAGARRMGQGHSWVDAAAPPWALSRAALWLMQNSFLTWLNKGSMGQGHFTGRFKWCGLATLILSRCVTEQFCFFFFFYLANCSSFSDFSLWVTSSEATPSPLGAYDTRSGQGISFVMPHMLP